MLLKQIRKYLHPLNTNQKLLILVAALPIVAVPAHLDTAKIVRWAIMATIALALLTMLARKMIKRPNKKTIVKSPWGILVALLTMLMIVSTFAGTEIWSVRLLGWDMELLGLASWLSFVVLAVTLRKDVTKTLVSPLFMIVTGLVVTVSMLISAPYFVDGFRAPGLLLQATSFAFYTCIALTVSVWQLLYGKLDLITRILAISVATISILAIIFCQSRAGQAAALLVLLLFAVSVVKSSRLKAGALVSIALGLIIVPLLFTNYFVRFQGEQLRSGTEYRLEVYRLSAEEVIGKNPLLGLGAGGVPENINSRDAVPYGILETLDRGYVFLSAHDIFLDMALMFGLGAVSICMLFILRACYNLLVAEMTPESVLITGVFVVLLINGLLNTPSIELTSLLFIVTAAVMSLKAPKKKASKTDI